MTRPAEVSGLHQPAAHTEETGEDSVLQAGPQDRSKPRPLQVEAQVTQGEHILCDTTRTDGECVSALVVVN